MGNHKANLYIITGGPGSGKTTLVEELKKCGFKCIDEVARNIIKNQLKINGDALPWNDAMKYKELMLQKSLEDHINAGTDEIIFLDRGIPDTLCYSKILGSGITADENEAVLKYRYNEKIFILPPWKEIYITDSERKQSWKEAVLTYKLMKETYTEYNYQIVEIPKMAVQERVDFILKHI